MVTSFLKTGLVWLHTTLAMIGKAFITGALSCIYNYTAELFPTPCRQIIFGTTDIMANLGFFISPYMGQMMVSRTRESLGHVCVTFRGFYCNAILCGALMPELQRVPYVV